MGGETGTVIGEKNYVQLCAYVGMKPIFKPKEKSDSSLHAFGTQVNCSEFQKITSRCVLILFVENGEWIPITAMVVDGKVLFRLGKDTLQMYDAVKSHHKQQLTLGARDRRV
eukprot:IDg21984t1